MPSFLQLILVFLALFSLNAYAIQEKTEENNLAIPFYGKEPATHEDKVKIIDKGGLHQFIMQNLNLQKSKGYKVTDEYTSSNGVNHFYIRQTLFGVEVSTSYNYAHAYNNNIA